MITAAMLALSAPAFAQPTQPAGPNHPTSPAEPPATPPAGPPPAPAGPADPRTAASKLAASAKAHFDHGEYTEAVNDYREAYRLLPTPGLLYNLGQAYRLAGDCRRAADAYREYLRLSPDTPYKATVEQNMSAAEACAKDAESGHEPTPPTPPPAPPPKPPPPKVEHPVIKTHVVEDPDAGHTQRLAGLATIGGGALLVAAGVYFAVDASHAQRDVAAFYQTGGDWSEIASVDARGHRSHWLAVGGFALGGAAIAAGATLYMLGRNDERAVAIVPTPTGGEVLVRWRF
jgi:tetratricopeptide (TPR) repeat protein